jgi:hypothetical protein
MTHSVCGNCVGVLDTAQNDGVMKLVMSEIGSGLL